MSLATVASLEATSAAGAMLMRQLHEPMLVGSMLADLGTSTLLVVPAEMVSLSSTSAQTTTGASFVIVARPGSAIAELRRLSGLTWEQLARLFGVSRRSIHFWVSGKAMTRSNEEHLQRLLALIRRMDRGFANVNRAELFAVREDGSIAFDLLAAREYDRVASLLGPGEARRVAVPKLSDEAVTARMPRPPDELVGALHDRAHHETGDARPARSARVRSGR